MLVTYIYKTPYMSREKIRLRMYGKIDSLENADRLSIRFIDKVYAIEYNQ